MQGYRKGFAARSVQAALGLWRECGSVVSYPVSYPPLGKAKTARPRNETAAAMRRGTSRTVAHCTLKLATLFRGRALCVFTEGREPSARGTEAVHQRSHSTRESFREPLLHHLHTAVRLAGDRSYIRGPADGGLRLARWSEVVHSARRRVAADERGGDGTNASTNRRRYCRWATSCRARRGENARGINPAFRSALGRTSSTRRAAAVPPIAAVVSSLGDRGGRIAARRPAGEDDDCD